SNHLALRDLAQVRTDQAFSQDAESQRSGAVAKCIRWPLDKFREVINKGCFNLVLRRSLGLSTNQRDATKQNRQAEQTDLPNDTESRMALDQLFAADLRGLTQKCHVSLP